MWGSLGRVLAATTATAGGAVLGVAGYDMLLPANSAPPTAPPVLPARQASVSLPVTRSDVGAGSFPVLRASGEESKAREPATPQEPAAPHEQPTAPQEQPTAPQEQPAAPQEQPTALQEQPAAPAPTAPEPKVPEEPAKPQEEPAAKVEQEEPSPLVPLSVVVQLEAALTVARSRLEDVELELHRQRREEEKRIVAIEQDLEAEMARALESRLALEREAMEDRKTRDLRQERALLDEQLRLGTEQAREQARRESVVNHQKRMRILAKFFEDVASVEAAVAQAKRERAGAVALFRLALSAHEIRAQLTRDTPAGRAKPELLAPLLKAELDDAVVQSALAAIPSHVLVEGVPTDPHLLAEYERAAAQGLAVALTPEESGSLLYLVSKVLTKTVVRPAQGLIEGDSADAVFARARLGIEQGDLATALEELNKLAPNVKQPCEAWVRACLGVV